MLSDLTVEDLALRTDGGWRNRADLAYEILKRLIVEGALAPGERLRELELAERLEVSRTPVREALWRLEQEGFVHTQRGEERRESTIVAPLTKQDVRELFHMVGALEGVVARWVAQFPDPQRERFCGVLAEVNEQFRAGVRRPGVDPLEVIALDRAFHQQLVDPTVGVRLLRTYDTLKPQTARYSLAYKTYWPESIDEHQALIDALRDGDADRASRAAAENYWASGDRICGVMLVQGERP